MIVDIDIQYRADFIPPRGRKVRKGHRKEKIPVDVREIASISAPLVLRVFQEETMVDVRIFEGLLYSLVQGGEETAEEIMNPAVSLQLEEHSIAPSDHRMDWIAHEDVMPNAPTRDLATAFTRSYVDQEFLVVDGMLHARVRIPSIPVTGIVAAYGNKANDIVRLTGSDFVPAWSPPTIEELPLAIWLSRIVDLDRRIPRHRADQRIRNKRLRDTINSWLSIDVVDRQLLAQASLEPRNHSMKGLAELGIERLREKLRTTPKRQDGDRVDLVWLSQILDATIAMEASAGTSLDGIEKMVAEMTMPSAPADTENVFSPCENRPSRPIQLGFQKGNYRTPEGMYDTEIPVLDGTDPIYVMSIGHHRVYAAGDDFLTRPEPEFPIQIPAAEDRLVLLDHWSLFGILTGRPGDAVKQFEQIPWLSSMRGVNPSRPIEGRDIAEFARHRLTETVDGIMMRCPEPLVAVFLEDDRIPLVSTSLSWELLALPGENPSFLFHADEYQAALDLCADASSKPPIERHPLGNVDSVKHVFDTDAWNLKVSLSRIVADADGRIGLMSKDDLEAFVRIVFHLRNWRADARSVAGPECESEFLQDAGVFLRNLKGPLFDDVGEEWVRDIAETSFRRVEERVPVIVDCNDDEAIRNFEF